MPKRLAQTLSRRDGFHVLRVGAVDLLLPRSPDAMPPGTQLLHWDWTSGWMRVGKTVALLRHAPGQTGSQRARRR